MRIGPVLLLISLLAPLAALGQGALTPPGAPAPLFKTLTQVEPRTPVQSLAGDAFAQFIISQPGSYYLTGNVTGAVSKAAISIDADNVTLDLGGFALVGVAGAARGIEIRNSHSVIAIRNGTIRTFDSAGINASFAQRDLVIDQVLISGISAGPGINFVSGSTSTNLVVRNCTVSAVAGGGILLSTTRGTVERCSVMDCTAFLATGIQAANVTGCEVNTVTGTGASVATGIAGQIITDCVVTAIISTNSGGAAIGINGPTVKGCQVNTVTSGTGPATGITGGAMAEGCTVNSVNSLAGGSATGINGLAVGNCRVTSVNNSSTNSSSATGIVGAAVHNCSVGTIGGSGSLGTLIGISATGGGGTVGNCTVNTVGSPVSGVGAVGISASTVADCTVSSVLGGTGGSSTGISASGGEVSRCNVNTIQLASGTGSCTGVSSEIISDCRINTLTSGGSNNCAGLSGYRVARNCSISTVLASGAGPAIGCVTGNVGRTENINVVGPVDVGVSVTSSQTVIGCSISSATIGILATGSRNVIDGNNVTGTGTTGISVTSGANNAAALVIRNQVRIYTTNFQLDAPCQLGPVVSAAGILAAGTNPFANFTD